MLRSLLAALALAVLAAPAAAAPPLHVAVERYQLPNGLTVMLHEDHRLPLVTVDTWFQVGSKDEADGRTGFAHLFEHLMFMGTRRVPNGQFDAIMEAVGGANNATTSEDRTNYFEWGPSNLLETFLYLEADRLSSLPDDMTAAKVDLQRDVVKNERRQVYENRPYGKVELLVPEHAFPVDHPYHHPVIGSHADLTAASVDDVKQFFRTFYVPSNATLAVVGDFRSADAKRLIERYLGGMAKAPVPPHKMPVPAPLARAETLTVDDAVELPQVTLAWASPPKLADGDAACELLAAVLGQGDGSRLTRALVRERKLAQQVEVEQRGMRGAGLLVVTVTAQPGRTADELERATAEEVAKLVAAQPPTAGELERARAQVETRALRELETPVGVADALQTFALYRGDPAAIDAELLGRFDQVTAAQLATQAKRVLSAPRLTLRVVPR